MAFSSVLPFLLPTHSVDCAVHLLLSHSRALLVSSPLFHPCPFSSVHRAKVPFFFLFFFKYQSHMAFSSVLPFLLPTHSVDCAVHLLLSHSRVLLVSSPLFHPFTALIMPFFLQFTALKCPFDGPFTALKCPFDGPFTALKCPFQMAPCPFENLGRTLTSNSSIQHVQTTACTRIGHTDKSKMLPRV